MLSAAFNPLVAGSARAVMATKHIQVTRPFYLGGKIVPAGKVLEVPAQFAAEMVSANKALIVEAKKPEAAAPSVPPAELPKRSAKNAG